MTYTACTPTGVAPTQFWSSSPAPADCVKYPVLLPLHLPPYYHCHVSEGEMGAVVRIRRMDPPENRRLSVHGRLETNCRPGFLQSTTTKCSSSLSFLRLCYSSCH